MIKVSVVIPVFNTGRYLEECLDSVLSQSLDEIEIICVNDGSVDDSQEILNRYAENYNQITVLNQVNRGQSAARNKALSIATGKYVYFMDSDDLITSHMLEELWNICEKKCLDVLYFSGTSFYESDELSEKHKGFENTYYRKGEYTEVTSGSEMLVRLQNNKDYFVSPCLQFIRRGLLQSNGIQYYEGIIHEDNYFSFQVILSAKRAFCVNDIYFYRRVRKNSVMTRSETKNNLKGYFTCLIKQMEFAATLDIQDDDVNKKIDYILWRLNFHVQRIYLLLSEDERKQFIQSCSSGERYFFNSVILKNIEMNVNNNKKIKQLRNKLNKTKKSNSYKIGRKITAPGRLIKGGVKCCKDHGIIYTCKLTIRKIWEKIR